jgi:hypothetical protein
MHPGSLPPFHRGASCTPLARPPRLYASAIASPTAQRRRTRFPSRAPPREGVSHTQSHTAPRPPPSPVTLRPIRLNSTESGQNISPAVSRRMNSTCLMRDRPARRQTASPRRSGQPPRATPALVQGAKKLIFQKKKRAIAVDPSLTRAGRPASRSSMRFLPPAHPPRSA